VTDNAEIDDSCFVLVTPPANRGLPAIVAVTRSVTTSHLKLEFQRQSFLYTGPEDLPPTTQDDFPAGLFSLATCPVDNPLSSYAGAKGLTNEADIERTLEHWGANHISVEPPSFLRLLREQLLSPLAMFQVRN
jgi:hypothetical protein